MRTTLVVAVLTVGLGLSPSPSADTLVPKKASDLRTVLALAPGNPCPGAASFRAVDSQQNPDGTSSSFSIPPKSVFVVTSVDVQTSNSAGHAAEALLAISDGTGGLAQVATCGAIAGSGGVAVASCDLSPGFAVKNGAALCTNALRAIVRGFIVKDK